MLGGGLGQPGENLFLLIGVEKGGSAGVWFGGESVRATSGVGSDPLGDSLTMNAKKGRNLRTCPAFVDPLDGETATSFQLRCTSFASHLVQVTMLNSG